MRTYDDYLLEYSDSEQIITVFITTGFGGATRIDGYRNIVAYFPVMIDSNNRLVEEDGRIEILVSNDDFDKNEYIKLEDNGIYKLLVSKCIPKELSPNILPIMNNRYLLKCVISRCESADATQSLISYREEYLKDVIVNIEGTDFVLNRRFGWYKGCCNFDGNLCSIFLYLDKGSKLSALNASERFKSVVHCLEDWNKNIVDRFISDLLSLANEWKEDEFAPDITPEQFADNLYLSNIVIFSDKRMEFSYGDNDLFGGHSIIAKINDKDEITECNIAG